LVEARIPELRANADGIFKIEVQNPDEFRKEFSAV